MKRIFIISLFLLMLPFITKAVDEQKYYDLKTESITITPSSPAVNQACKITVVVKNTGTIGLISSQGAGSFRYIFNNFYITNIKYTTPASNNLIPKSSGTLTYEFEGKFTKNGDQNLYFSVNDNRELLEQKINEDGYSVDLYDDNTIRESVLIVDEGGDDVQIQPISISMSKPIVDTDVVITVNLKNIGKTSITNPNIFSDTNYILEADNFNIKSKTVSKAPSIIEPFDYNEIYKIEYTGAFFNVGAKNVGFKFDKGNVLSETNEDNNSTSTSIFVYLNQEQANAFSIIDFKVFDISSTSVRVDWKTDQSSTGKLLYRRTEYVHNEELISSSEKTDHSLVVNNLIPGLSYFFQIEATKGNVAKHSDVITNKLKQDIPKFLENAKVVVNSDKVKVEWKTDVLSNSSLYFRKKGETEFSSQKDSENYVVNHLLEKVLPDGEYEYYVESTSKVGGTAKTNVSTLRVGYVEPEIFKEAEKNDSTTNNQMSSGINIEIKNQLMYSNLKGKIVLKVESNGEAYYINPKSQTMHYLGRPEDAFGVMREQGVGISTKDLEKIEIGLASLSGTDSDGDGLSDMFEDAIGTNKNKKDTDSDGFEDKAETESGYNPKGAGRMDYDKNFAKNHYGKIFLQVEGKGEAWYVSPTDGKRYFLGRPGDAFSVMRNLGLGISNSNFEAL